MITSNVPPIYQAIQNALVICGDYDKGDGEKLRAIDQMNHALISECFTYEEATDLATPINEAYYLSTGCKKDTSGFNLNTFDTGEFRINIGLCIAEREIASFHMFGTVTEWDLDAYNSNLGQEGGNDE